MVAPQRKYVVDTNLFIQAFREPAANAALERFHAAFGPFEYLAAIVAQELRAGVQNAKARRQLEESVLGVFARAQRVIAPSREAWERSGNVLAEMVWKEGLELTKVSKAFGNDVLLAQLCREHGLVLITENQRDFRRIQRYLDFEFIPPWPA
jgi:predicted nucleic acid-binding protein